jgi:anti-sigma B factor antagonist
MFEAVVSKEGKVLTLSLRGECDLQTSPELAELITASIANGCSSLKIDLRGLTFIDSTGLRTLVQGKTHIESAGADLSIVPGSRSVMRVFEVVGLLDELPFEGTGRASL